ncbi:helix-turn-helix domain protein [Parvibaculum lavamentivorans DS-1]|uniref:Helix-turn-helix domain protein n=1 Tax=Parvibaculum lavamentivorans (strain DS-1 / DSM 13023 / NCIMB 13966) TaxID=402881 RepID=A7HUI5_PARL1|nr:helix-turn-helix domain-containing protein [Parvibaculum lavamentivorans]ABS63568.1 helix-turn-helix domain protein [Parvibaculum lavamentivorans DS-1]
MSDFAKELISSMEEALEHARGGKTGVRVHTVAPVDVKKARKALKMTQPDFARLVGTSVSGLQKWEQGKRQPGGAARTLITLIMRAPEAVRDALEERDEKLSA